MLRGSGGAAPRAGAGAACGVPSAGDPRLDASRGVDSVRPARSFVSHRRSSELEPAAGDRRVRLAPLATCAFRSVSAAVVRPRRDRVDDRHAIFGTEAIDDLGAHQRGDVLGRLQPRDRRRARRGRRVIAGSVVNSKRDVDVAVLQRLAGERTTGVEANERLELEAVHASQPGEAQRPRRAFGRTAEGELGGDSG